ncbi:MAG: hypothetical protein HUK09_09340 [Bacteroidaceae bacterium]|nr:hypothetical protein [Bacteroidaceae bacterium]
MKKALLLLALLTASFASYAQEWVNISELASVQSQMKRFATHYTQVQQVKGQNQFRILNFLNSGVDFEFSLPEEGFDATSLEKCKGNVTPTKFPLFSSDAQGTTYFYLTSGENKLASGFQLGGSEAVVDSVKFVGGAYSTANFATEYASLEHEGTTYGDQGYIRLNTFFYTDGATSPKWDNVTVTVWISEATLASIGAATVAPSAIDAPVYDLSGRRVQQPSKGIYIQGGQKKLFP